MNNELPQPIIISGKQLARAADNMGSVLTSIQGIYRNMGEGAERMDKWSGYIGRLQQKYIAYWDVLNVLGVSAIDIPATDCIPSAQSVNALKAMLIEKDIAWNVCRDTAEPNSQELMDAWYARDLYFTCAAELIPGFKIIE